ADRRHRMPLGTFGDPSRLGIGSRERNLLFREFARQQRWSFGLVWFATGIGICLGALIVGRVSLGPASGLGGLLGGAGIVADVSLGAYAWRLYKTSSQRVERLL